MTEPREMASLDELDGGVTVSAAGAPPGAAPARPAPDIAEPSAPPPHPSRRIGFAEAIRWHWATFAIAVVLITALAIAAGFLRNPDYTAEAKLAISETAGGAAGLAGFAANSQSLASGFSQAVNAPGVVRRVARRLDLPQGEVRSNITASSTVGSPVVRIQAVSTSASSAVSLANATSAALIAYVNGVNDGEGATQEPLLKKFRAATVRVNRLRSRVKALGASGSDSADLNKARATRDAAELVAGAASAAYKASQEGRASASRLQVLSPAGQASSDRTSKLQLLGFIGLLIGIAVGATLASIRANGWPGFG